MVRPPNFLRWIYPNAIWHLPSDSKVVYLTFDDGPTPGVTEKVLEILENYQAKATFFCIGKNVVQHPDLYSLVIQKGHHVGSHTFSHLNGWKTNSKDYLDDYLKGKRQINSNLFRPPYGRLMMRSLLEIQKHDKVIMWDILSKDYDQRLNSDAVISNIKQHLCPGAIIVFHDSLKAKNNLLAALPQILQHLQIEGFSMETIPY